MKSYYSQVGLSFLCGLFGKTRQAYYDHQNRKERRQFEHAIILDLVRTERSLAARIGGRKLFQILQPQIAQHQIKLGRDGFFDLLRQYDLLIRPLKNYTVTTNSRHRFRKYPNLVKGLTIRQSERVWVSDITYIRVQQQFYYLILITDAYSRKVVGHHFSHTMDAAFCVEALNQALTQRQYPNRKLIHHSDRGIQYCSDKYTAVLKDNQVQISMTQNGDPYENALAERMNRTFKNEFHIGRTFSSDVEARRTIAQSIEYYNHRLPHSSCDNLTPAQAHHRQGELKKHWKTKAQRKETKSESKKQKNSELCPQRAV